MRKGCRARPVLPQRARSARQPRRARGKRPFGTRTTSATRSASTVSLRFACCCKSSANVEEVACRELPAEPLLLWPCQGNSSSPESGVLQILSACFLHMPSSRPTTRCCHAGPATGEPAYARSHCSCAHTGQNGSPKALATIADTLVPQPPAWRGLRLRKGILSHPRCTSLTTAIKAARSHSSSAVNATSAVAATTTTAHLTRTGRRHSTAGANTWRSGSTDLEIAVAAACELGAAPLL